MKNFETPIDFIIEEEVQGLLIKYLDMSEISQGGPVVGTISIDNKVLYGKLFGGPFLSQDDYIYIPMYIRRFIGWGFKLAIINIKNLEISVIGKTMNLIYIDKIEGNRIFFFENINKSKGSSYNIG